MPDGRNILQRARHEANDYLKNFAVPILGNILSDRLALYVHQYTIYGSYRPFGAAVLLSSYDPYDGYGLHLVEPSGHVYAYHACAHGKGRSLAKSEFERKDYKNFTCREALPHLAKMYKYYSKNFSLVLAHEEFKDK